MVTKEVVEFDYKKALMKLADQGNYALMQQLIALFSEEKYKEVSNILQTI